jgi:hypothetical protein
MGPMRPPDTRPFPAPIHRLLIGAAVAIALVLSACNNPASPSSSNPPTTASSAASAQPGTSGASSETSASTLAAGQTDSDWGRIWDRLPATFPVYPGAAPAEEAQTGPVSAIFAIENGDAQTIATWMRAELERAAFRTEALNGPLEDGSFVLDSAGDTGCRVEVAAAPLGDLTTLAVRYGAACPSP